MPGLRKGLACEGAAAQHGLGTPPARARGVSGQDRTRTLSLGIYRALKRAELIDPKARRRRDRRFKRWERGGPMELWQMDVVGGVLLGDGREAKILTGIDDLSRFVVCSGLMLRATSRAVCSHFAGRRCFGSYVQVPFHSPLNLVSSHPCPLGPRPPEYRVTLTECGCRGCRSTRTRWRRISASAHQRISRFAGLPSGFVEEPSSIPLVTGSKRLTGAIAMHP